MVLLSQSPSTNDLGKRLARNYLTESAPVPAADVVAWSQEAGRGRRPSRTWSSPASLGVYLTLVRDVPDPAILEGAPMAAAVAACEVVNRSLAGRCRLRWPNDLVVDGRKLGGILIEAVSRGGASALVLGFGINHGGTEASFEAPRPTTMAVETDRPPALDALVDDLSTAVDDRLGQPLATLLAAYRESSAHREGDTLSVRIDDQPRNGVFRGFDPHGFLCLDVDGTRHRLPAGEVASSDD